jgi:hypothetical protein
MAVTIVPFTPVTNANFQFFPELDGVTYTATITWNAFGLRYYITLTTNQNVTIFTQPLIGSPDNYNINLAEGYFTTPLVYRQMLQQFEIG